MGLAVTRSRDLLIRGVRLSFEKNRGPRVRGVRATDSRWARKLIFSLRCVEFAAAQTSFEGDQLGAVRRRIKFKGGIISCARCREPACQRW